jgi:hypothetical protein
MLGEDAVGPRRGRFLRTRLALDVVDAREARGFLIPHQAGGASFRGGGSADYACGTCGALLAIGVRPGMFRTFVFACSCGALNQVR